MLIAYGYFYQDIKNNYMTFKISIKQGYSNLATCTEVWSFVLFKGEHNDSKEDGCLHPKVAY